MVGKIAHRSSLPAIFAVFILQMAGAVLAAERTTSFAIRNMTCALCPITVERAMRGVDGVKDVVISFQDKTALVKFEDSQTNPDAIANASLNAGYPATVTK